MTLDEATVRALLATAQSAIGDDRNTIAMQGLACGFAALAAEVLALREQRCGTCRYWIEKRKIAKGVNVGVGPCTNPSVYGTRTATWGCADWQAKEEER